MANFCATRHDWLPSLSRLVKVLDWMDIFPKQDLTVPMVLAAMRAQGIEADSTPRWNDPSSSTFRVTEHGNVISIQRRRH